MLTGNSGITTNASKAKTKSYLADIKEEYELYLSEKRMDDEYDLDTLYANDKTIRYEGNEVGTGIAEICSSIKKGDEKKFKIIVFRGNGLFRSVITPYIESKMLFTNCFDYILENVDNSYF